jgi:hypothetical protein
MKHAMSVSSIYAFVGRWCQIMFRNLRYIDSDACLAFALSVCCFATIQHEVEVIWHVLQMTSGTLGVCIHIADSWVRFWKNMKSLFWNKDVSAMHVLYLRRYSTTQNICWWSMMTSNMFCVVEQRLKQSTYVINTSLFQNKLFIFVGDPTQLPTICIHTPKVLDVICKTCHNTSAPCWIVAKQHTFWAYIKHASDSTYLNFLNIYVVVENKD